MEPLSDLLWQSASLCVCPRTHEQDHFSTFTLLYLIHALLPSNGSVYSEKRVKDVHILR